MDGNVATTYARLPACVAESVEMAQNLARPEVRKLMAALSSALPPAPLTGSAELQTSEPVKGTPRLRKPMPLLATLEEMQAMSGGGRQEGGPSGDYPEKGEQGSPLAHTLSGCTQKREKEEPEYAMGNRCQ